MRCLQTIWDFALKKNIHIRQLVRHKSSCTMDVKEVVKRLESFAPPNLAESWDNTGLLVEPSTAQNINTLMLTIDLTEDVTLEAVEKNADMILAYHPPIFQPLKRLTQKTWKERVIVTCIERKIAVYSPHTRYDALLGGINDWLLSPFAGKTDPLKTAVDSKHSNSGGLSATVLIMSGQVDEITKKLNSMTGVTVQGHMEMAGASDSIRLFINCTQKSLTEIIGLFQKFTGISETLEIVQLGKPPLPGVGSGRIMILDQPTTIAEIVERVKSNLNLTFVRLALAKGRAVESPVKTIAVCAGSGGSLLSGVSADVFLTGEMSHHEVLDANHNGTTVLLCDHTNTERGFLTSLQQTLTASFDGKISVLISSKDRDPLEIV